MAAVCFALAVAGAVLLVPGYEPRLHPFGLIGALPGALSAGFNLVAFIVPGALSLLVLSLLRPAPVSAWSGSIGRQLGVIAALGYLSMGVFTLDLEDLVGFGARAHATAWMVWLAAAMPAAVLVGHGLFSIPRLRLAGGLSIAAAMAIAVLCMVGIGPLDGPLAQLVSWAIWLLWILMLARVAAKRA